MKYVITEDELLNIVVTAGDVIRGDFGQGDKQKAQGRLLGLLNKVHTREIEAEVMGFYVIDENGDPKCQRFKG